MAKRLIDANALIKYMCDHCGVSCNLEDECCSSVDAVDNQPAIDAVSVVRCRDCRHMTIEQGLRYCNAWERFNGDGDDGFCNYGGLR